MVDGIDGDPPVLPNGENRKTRRLKEDVRGMRRIDSHRPRQQDLDGCHVRYYDPKTSMVRGPNEIPETGHSSSYLKERFAGRWGLVPGVGYPSTPRLGVLYFFKRTAFP